MFSKPPKGLRANACPPPPPWLCIPRCVVVHTRCTSVWLGGFAFGRIWWFWPLADLVDWYLADLVVCPWAGGSGGCGLGHIYWIWPMADLVVTALGGFIGFGLGRIWWIRPWADQVDLAHGVSGGCCLGRILGFGFGWIMPMAELADSDLVVLALGGFVPAAMPIPTLICAKSSISCDV